jgi:hypothetical protein
MCNAAVGTEMRARRKERKSPFATTMKRVFVSHEYFE